MKDLGGDIGAKWNIIFTILFSLVYEEQFVNSGPKTGVSSMQWSWSKQILSL